MRASGWVLALGLGAMAAWTGADMSDDAVWAQAAHRRPGVAEPDGTVAGAGSGTAWTLVGPVGVNSAQFGVVSGRVSALALDPADGSGNRLFVGTTGGGVWKSQNAAATGTVQLVPATDGLAILSGVARAGLTVGALSVQPGGTGVVLAGLGDPNDATDSYYGAGLLRSADGGATWTLIEQTMDLESGLGGQDFSFIGEGFAGFAWSTANAQLVVAAVNAAFEGVLVNAGEAGSSYKGLYWSNDSGATWHLGRITDLNGQDVQGPLDGFAPPDGNGATSVVWNPVRQVFVAAVQFHGYYQSTDGMSWTRLLNQPGTGLTSGNCPTEPGGLGVAGCPIFRGSLAVNPQTGDTFAWTVDAFNQDQGIWQDQCGIASGVCGNPAIGFGAQLDTTALEVADGNGPASIANGDYNLTLAAVPGGLGAGQDTLLFAGDNDLWKCSLANSCVWRNTTNTTSCASAGVGEFQHGFAWDAGNPLVVFAGNDSGLWRSLDQVGETGAVCAGSDASHWQNLNGSVGASGSLAEVATLGQSATAAGTLLVGLGVNGFAGVANAPTTPGNWNQVLGGEGGPVAVDPASTTNSWYANTSAGVAIFHCSSATAATACTPAGFTSAIGEAQVANDGLTMPYPADFVLDGMTPGLVVIGTCRVWRGPANGTGWSAANAISPVLDGTGGVFCNGNALIRSLAVLATADGGEVIYAGMAGNLNGGVVPGHLFSATVSQAGVVSGWTDLAYSPVSNDPLGFNAFGFDVSGVYVDPHDATGGTVYATIAGFGSSQGAVSEVYQSTDGGGHWVSIRSNLPNVPVNAVLVDGQDANTVYVGTDLGVFATQAVGTCGSGLCWSAYGSGLPLVPVTALAETRGTTPVLTAGTYGRGVWQAPPATAGVTLTTASVSPGSLTFASQTVGTSSLAQTVTLKNTGNAVLNVSAVTGTGSAAADFVETDNCVGAAVAKAGSCTLKVSFAPTAAGSRTGALAIRGNVSGGQLLLPVSGTGLAAGAITLLPASVSFGAQLVGTTSNTQNVSVQNGGGTAVSITSLTVSTGPFRKTASSCGGGLAAGTACSVTLVFGPSQPGAATGSLTVVDSAGTQTATLTGMGIAQATDTLSTTSVGFPATVLGQSSAAMAVTISNTGGVALTSIGTSVSGPFSVVNNCGSQLTAGNSCGISVVYTPTALGSQTGQLVISDALRSQTVKLSGAGIMPAAIKLSPTTISFGSQQMGTTSAAKTLTVTNSGGAPLGQPGFSLSGAGAASFAVGATTCVGSLAAGASCTVNLTFMPVGSGTATATVTVSTPSAGVASATAALSGTGLTPPTLAVAPAAVNLGTVVVGNSSALFTVTVTNGGQVALNGPTFAVSGMQAADFALSAPSDVPACTGTLNPRASCDIQVTFSPSVVGAEAATLTVTGSNAVPSMATVSLSGTGAAAIVLQASPAQLSFAGTAVGAASAAQTVSISNLGRQTANGVMVKASGPYQLAPGMTTCKTTLAKATSCSVGVIFVPVASGDQPGTLTVTVSNLGVAPLTVPLDGTGVAVGGITASPTALVFGSVVVQTASAAQVVTVTNSGQGALTGLGLAATGDYSLVQNGCGGTLAAQGSCTVGVVFSPSTTGVRTGVLTVSSSSTGVTPAVVSLTGSGLQAGSLLANPAVVSFGGVTLGQTSPGQTVTLTNSGATTLAGLQLQVAGDYSLAQNGCGAMLASGAMCSFAVSFAPTLPGTRIGSVTVAAANAGFVPLVVGLTGKGLPSAMLAVTPGSLTFPAVAVGLNSTAMQLTVMNSGSGTLTGLSASATLPFSVGSGSCGASLAAGSSCMLPVTFAPTAAGTATGVVTISSTSLGVSPVMVAATGTGVAPAALTLTPAGLNFAATTIGVTSAGVPVSVTDTGGVGVTGIGVTASGDFAVSSTNCGVGLAAGAGCMAVVTFTPTVAGGRMGFLTVSGTSAAGNQTVTATGILTGSGLTPAALSAAPVQLTFATTQVGLSSPTQVVTLSNGGQSAIAGLQLAVTAGFRLDQTKTNCGAALAAGASCMVGVMFAPAAAGAVPGSLTASFAGPGGTGSASVALSGTGALPPGIVTMPGAVVNFGTVGVGETGPAMTVTVTNQGGLTQLSGLSFALDTAATTSGFGFTGNTCLNTLGPGASCTASLIFTPTGAGTLTGALTVSSANGGNPAILLLSGAGFDFSLTVSGSGSATVVRGQTAYYTLAVTSLGGSPGTAYSLSCGSLPANAACVFNPGQLGALPAGGTGNVMLGISTGGPVTAAKVNDAGRGWGEAGLLVCCAACLPWWRRRRSLGGGIRVSLVAVMLAGMICSLSGCVGAGGSGGNLHFGGGTPPGSYMIQVTATSDGLTHSKAVQLVVN